jgi:hypothetical protein
MALNMFGNEVEPRPMTLKWLGEHLTLFRGGRFTGMVSKNGWTGKSVILDYKPGEPVLYNVHGMFSLDELKTIVTECHNKFEIAAEVPPPGRTEQDVDLVAELVLALEESLKLQTHYARMLNDYDGGERMGFHTVQDWLNRLHEIGTLAEPVKSPAKTYCLEDVRKQYPNAYVTWDKEQDDLLCSLIKQGETVEFIANAMGRKPSAIEERLVRLNRIRPQTKSV